MNNIPLFLGILFYTIGCIAYTYDALKSKPINKVVLAACICFDIGSLFFMIDYFLTYNV
tara:strand:+ start:64 stop:240 length:177 start_codon:yes stop_codon:yes gene_type:complete